MMGFQIFVTVHQQFIRIEVRGNQTVDAVTELLQTIQAESHRSQRNHVLVDYRAVAVHDLSTGERVLLGSQLAAAAGSRLKIAVIYDAPRIDQTTIRTATQRGASVTTVSSEEEGVAWLASWRPR
jgi:hypothetical protein